MTKLPTVLDRTAFGPLFDHSIGFDRMLDRIFDDFVPAAASVSFPPYNIRKVNETDRMIEMALAGYSEKDIDITIENGILTISGGKSEETNDQTESYIHRGVAARKFKRQFKLADHAEVKEANLEHGMLSILVAVNEPETEIKRIPINV